MSLPSCIIHTYILRMALVKCQLLTIRNWNRGKKWSKSVWNASVRAKLSKKKKKKVCVIASHLRIPNWMWASTRQWNVWTFFLIISSTFMVAMLICVFSFITEWNPKLSFLLHGGLLIQRWRFQCSLHLKLWIILFLGIFLKWNSFFL